MIFSSYPVGLFVALGTLAELNIKQIIMLSELEFEIKFVSHQNLRITIYNSEMIKLSCGNKDIVCAKARFINPNIPINNFISNPNNSILSNYTQDKIWFGNIIYMQDVCDKEMLLKLSMKNILAVTSLEIDQKSNYLLISDKYSDKCSDNKSSPEISQFKLALQHLFSLKF